MGKWVLVCFCGIPQGTGGCTERSRKKERKKERKLVIGWQERNKRSVIWGTTVVVWCGVPQCCHQFLKLNTEMLLMV